MKREWVHSDFRITAKGYYPCPKRKIALDRGLHFSSDSHLRSSFPAVALVTLVFAALLSLPFFLIFGHSGAGFTLTELPKIAGGTMLARDQDAFVNSLSVAERRKFERQVEFVQNIVRGAKNKKINDLEIAYTIVAESYRANYDPLFVTSVALAESSFRKGVRSSAGAIGLMQIQPATGRYVAKMSHQRWRGSSFLKDPRYNVRLGISYLKYLKNRFNGNIQHALVAYNWGPTNMTKSLKSKKKKIPSVSKSYHKKIMKNYRRWKAQFAQKVNGSSSFEADLRRAQDLGAFDGKRPLISSRGADSVVVTVGLNRH